MDSRETKPTREEVREELKIRLEMKKLGRKSRFARDTIASKMKLRISQERDKAQKEKIEHKLEYVEDLNEREDSACPGEYPEYGDGASYGGQMDHPE